MDENELLIGLDVGSSSVGWAATDENFKLKRIKGKTAWGARIFDEAQSAQDRRAKRSARRRSDRRKYRIYLLNSLFDNLISEKDPSFFLRLQNSSFLNEDKDENVKDMYPLFISKDEEKNFYKRFPTIWHLRKELLNKDSDAFNDIRNVYLAIHHILKYRGNFLTEGTIQVNKFDNKMFDDINDFMKNLGNRLSEDFLDDYICINKENYSKIIKELEDTNKNVKDKKKAIINLLNPNEELTPYLTMFASLVSGGSFDSSSLNDEYEKKSIKFDNSFEDSQLEIASILKDDFELVVLAKAIFDFVKLKDLLNNEDSLSKAFVTTYESHKEQLIALKAICKKIDSDNSLEGENSIYYQIFKDKENEKNYASFVHVNSNKKRCSIEDFNKYVLSILSKYEKSFEKDKDFNCLVYLAQRNKLLLTIANNSTSLIPHQLHEKELITILDNASLYYPEILGFKDKILSIFKFRVPYYFGPLNTNSEYSNVIKNREEKILPWNVDDVVNISKTKEQFIKKLTNSCTYLIGENSVLPRESICYQKYIILDKVNSLTINGSHINQEEKAEVFTYILSRKKTTLSALKKHLINTYKIYANDGVIISGIDENDAFINDSYDLFRKLFDVVTLNQEQLNKAERIIELLTIYKDNYLDGKAAVESELNNKLTKEQESLLRSKQFNSWGRLSRRLLTGIRHIDDNGVALSILDVMESETLNFQQVINDNRYNFKALIKNENDKFVGNKTKDDVINDIIDDVSPKMRRSIIQSIRIVDEISKFANQEPKYISIEVTREDDEKKKGKKTSSRFEEASNFVKSLLKDNDEFIKKQATNVLNELSEFKEGENALKLKSKHIYLYFKQNGIDLYTGKPIQLDDVLNSEKYDIDHIVPQHLIKDDSLDNMVLVERTYNQNVKKGLYPIPETIRCNENVVKIWKILYRSKGISDKKYNNLMRASEITEDELNAFINAQINVVNQSNITIKKILEIKYPNTTLIFSKAHYPSYLRQEYQIPKLRDLNDTHHAVDAFLNIVCGVTLYREYSKNYFINKQNNDFSYNMENRLKYVLSKNSLEKYIQDVCFRHDFLLTYRNTYNDSQFYDITINKKGDGELVPVHTKGAYNKTDKYGGYSGLVVSHFLTATIDEKKKILVDVPALFSHLYKDDSRLKLAIIKNSSLENYKNVSIDFKKRILTGQKIKINNCYYILSNKNKITASLKPCTQIFLSKESQLYLSKCLNRIDSFADNYDGNSFDFVLNRKGDVFTISKEANHNVFAELLNISNHQRYDKVPMISDIRKMQPLFDTKSLFDQVLMIKNILLLLTRKSTDSKITKNSYLVSKNSIFSKSDKIEIVYDSITGLQSYFKTL